MKNFRKNSIFTVILSMMLYVSCSTDEQIESQEPVAITPIAEQISLLEYSNSTARGGGNSSMLVFNDIYAFRNTIAQLEQQVETNDDAFITRNSNLNADQLTEKERAIGFDMYKPLKDFVALYGFNNSMLKNYQIVESNWLNKPSLIESNDPDKEFYDLDEEEMAVLNNVGAVKIGNSIFKVFDGGVAEITDGDINTLNLIANYRCVELEQLRLDNLVVSGSCGGTSTGGGNTTPTSSCFYDGVTRSNWDTASKRKMKGVVKVVNSPDLWGVKIKSKTKFYKKVWSVWIRKRSNLTAALKGYYDAYDASSCGANAFYFDENINKKSVSNKSKAKYVINVNPSGQYFLIKENTVKGVHKQMTNRREHYLKD